MSDETLIEEAAQAAFCAYHERRDLSWRWNHVATAMRDFWAAHTEPASGDVTLVQALRMAAEWIEQNYYLDTCPGLPEALKLRAEADRLEAAQATRESDIRIGRAYLARRLKREIPEYNSDQIADVGRAAREVVDAERGQAK